VGGGRTRWVIAMMLMGLVTAAADTALDIT
jgi:hypothetical protein